MGTSSSSASAGRLALIGATLLVAGACAAPRALPATGEATVPIQTISGHTFVSVSVNDSPAGTLFLVDTGATRTVLNPSLARRLGITVPDDAPKREITVFGGRTVSVPFVRVRSLGVGNTSVADILVGVYDATPNSPAIDGVLGVDFLGRFRVTLDTTQRTMHLTSLTPSTAPEQAARAEPAHPPSSGVSLPAERKGEGVDASSWSALTAPPVWKPGYEWSYRWHSPQGSGTFVWSVDREDVLDGVAVYVVRSGSRELFYRKSDLALSLERIGSRIQTRWVPPVGNYSWPVTSGKTWEQSYTRERPVERQTEVRTIECRAGEGQERITVPAGTFTTVKVTCRFMPAGSLSHELCYSPEVRHLVRDRTPLSYGVRERELTGYKIEPR